MSAGSYICLRSMKDNHTLVVTTWVNLCLLIASFVAVMTLSDFHYITELSANSWLLLALTAVLAIWEKTCKFIALKYEEASKLVKYSFLPNVWIVCVEVLVGAAFSLLQVVGLTVVFGYYLVHLVISCRKHHKTSDDSYERMA